MTRAHSLRIAQSVLGAALALASPAWAVQYACTGKVERVSTSPAGVVNATFVFQSGTMAAQDVCSLGADSAGAGCKGSLAMLLLARQTQQDVSMWFDNSTGSCSSTSWKPLKDMGWYWGPSF